MADNATTPWYAFSVKEALARLEASPEGLSSTEAGARLRRCGPNTIRTGRETNPWTILFHQTKSPLIYILLVAMAITLAIQHWADAIVIGAVVALNTVIGFVQEYRAENAMQALLGLTTPRARVRRDGMETVMESAGLVPGDVVLIEAGDIVPADVRLLGANRLQIDESLLTGESVPAAKSVPAPPEAANLPPQSQSNMAFMGTAVVSGKGTGLVVATALKTQMGSIAEGLVGTTRAETPLQTRMRKFGWLVSLAIVGASVVAFAVGLALGEPVVDMFLTAVAIAVSAIPEGLPVVMSVALAVGVRRMARRNAIIRRLPAVETLGSCTVIMSDKTGTLTQNQMTVQTIWADDNRFHVTGGGLDPHGTIERNGETVEVEDGSALYLTLMAGLLPNEASLYQEEDVLVPGGDPTEVALLVSGAKARLNRDDLLERFPLTYDVPFDSDWMYAASVHSHSGREIVFVKGALEPLLEMCTTQAGHDGAREIDVNRINEEARNMAEEGLRVLAMAMGEGPLVAEAIRSGRPAGLTFLGLQGMMDPPREEVTQAVAACHRAGIRVIMVTGDNPVTAAAIAQRVGIGRGVPEVRTGTELASMSDEELQAVATRVSVYARVRPSQKLRLVNCLRRLGHIVAVTGDGVNDAPALKSAHIGAAMGRSGTDVAKEASEMVLTDDNFATVYAAVEEGRTAFANIRKATFFLISSGIGELVAILASLGLRWPLPLLPAQILWLNLVTNGIEDVALAFEPGEKEQLQRPPISPKEGILSRVLIERSIIVGLVVAAGTLAMFAWERGAGSTLAYARVTALTTMVTFQVFHVLNCRSEYKSAFRKSPLSNRLLLVGTALSLVAHIGAMYLAPTQFLLRLEPLSLETWGRVVLVALSVIAVVEVHKLLRRPELSTVNDLPSIPTGGNTATPYHAGPR